MIIEKIILTLTFALIASLTCNLIYFLENRELKKELQTSKSNRKGKLRNRFIFVSADDEIRMPELVSGKQLN